MKKDKEEFSLSRDDGLNSRERNAGKIVIYTEGNVTEPEYLNDWIRDFALKNNLNPNRVKTWFKIVPSYDESEPLKVVGDCDIKRTGTTVTFKPDADIFDKDTPYWEDYKE